MNATWSTTLKVVGAVLLVAAALGTTMSIVRTTKGSGTVVSRSVPVAAFARIEVSNGFDVDLSVGAEQSVTLRTDDNVVDLVDISVVDGDVLRIGLVPRSGVSDATLHVDVSARQLTSIVGSGGASVRINSELESERFHLGLSGGARIIGALDVADADLDLSGGAHATLTGSARRLVSKGQGASILEATTLQADDAVVDVSGASQANVAAAKTLSAAASGSSLVRYVGHPALVRQDVSGASSITTV